VEPRAALDELLMAYRDQSRHLVKADKMYRAEPTSVSLGSRVPPALARYRVAVPLVRIAVNAYADRISIENVTFGDPNTDVAFGDMRDNLQAAVSTAATEALACGIGYVRGFKSGDKIHYSAVRGRDGAFLEDPDTGEIQAVLRVHRPRPWEARGPIAIPSAVTVYTPGKSVQFTRKDDEPGGWAQAEAVNVPDDGLLMVPLINRARAGEPYGTSEGHDLYDLQDAAGRALTGLSIAVDALAVPQRVLIATLPESIADLSQIKAYTDSILALSGDVKVDQWQAAQLEPFIITLNGLDRKASAISGLPLSYWGIASEANASSGDAIRENDTRLEIRARKLDVQWTDPIQKLVTVTAKLITLNVVKTVVKWTDPATPTPTAAADAAVKLSAIPAINGETVVDREMIWNILRVPPADRERILAAGEVASLQTLLNAPETPPTEGAPNEPPASPPSP
jgi:hypothetical protein